MAMRKGFGLALAAMGVALFFVASATIPLFHGMNVRNDSLSDKGAVSEEASADSAASADSEGEGAKPAKDGTAAACGKASSVLGGKVVDMSTGGAVAGALVTLKPVKCKDPNEKPLPPPPAPPAPPGSGRPLPEPPVLPVPTEKERPGCCQNDRPAPSDPGCDGQNDQPEKRPPPPVQPDGEQNDQPEKPPLPPVPSDDGQDNPSEKPPLPPEKPDGEQAIQPGRPPMPPAPPVPPGSDGQPPKPPIPPDRPGIDGQKPSIPPVKENPLQAKSDAKGFYSIRVPAGYYMMEVQAKGYLPYSDHVEVAKGTKMAHDVALTPAPPKPVPDCFVKGTVSDAATGEGIPGALVVIVHLPDNFPKLTDEQKAALKERLEALRERLGEQLTEEERAALKERLEALRERLGGQLTEEERAALKERLEALRERLGGQLTEEQKAALKERLESLKDNVQDRPGGLKDGLLMPILVKTDENGNYWARCFSGRTLVFAFAEGYNSNWAKVDLPGKGRAVVDLVLEKRPEPRVLRLKLVWGYLDENNPEGKFTPWDGSISVRNAQLKLVDTVQFEMGGEYRNGGDDAIYPQKERNTVSWRSSTTVARDGVVVDILVMPGDGHAVTLSAGSWSVTVPLERLAGIDVRIGVGGSGHQVLIRCEPLGPATEGPR